VSPQPAAVQAISRALAAELSSRTAWDEPPCLYTIRLQAAQYRLQPVPIPLAAWATGRPPDVLEEIALAAEIASRIPGARRHRDLYGAAFRCEGWGLDMRGLDAGQRREAEADSAAHRIHARPDRIEYRLLVAADRTGATYAARQQRGQDEVFTDSFTPGSALRHDGAVPAALARVTAALTGVPLPRPYPPEPGP
jgi:hypothetical protein